MCFLSFLFSLLITFFDVLNWNEWTLKDFILFRSYQMTESIFVWSTDNYRNVTEIIDKEYATNITITSATLGIICTVMNFSGILQDFVIQDLALFASLTVYAEAQKVAKTITPLSDAADSVYNSTIEGDWGKCASLKALSDSGNHAFGLTLKVLHIRNLFATTLVLLEWLKNDIVPTYNLTMTLHTCKVTLFYWIALKASENVSDSELPMH